MYRSIFLDLGTSWRWRWSASRPCHFTPGKKPRYPFYRRLRGPQSRSGRYGEVKIFYPTGTRTPALPGRPARSQSLYLLSYPGSLVVYTGISKIMCHGTYLSKSSNVVTVFYCARDAALGIEGHFTAFIN
jgi:hypothetical protein